jgi:subtilase family serine protease
VKLPAVTAGAYYVIAQADVDDAIAEADEDDNVVVKRILVGPDLILSRITTAAAPTSSSPTTIRVTTANLGGDSAPASSTRLYRSTNGAIDAGDTLLRAFAIPGLPPNTSEVSEVTVMLPAGTYYLIAQVDVGGVVNEVVETNNLRKVTATVP